MEYQELINKYLTVRQKTLDLCSPLEIEDMVVQPASFVSPPKWHLAHTTWFFVAFVFNRFGVSYTWPDKTFPHLFNSYYKSKGQHWVQGRRGDLSRPTVKQIQSFRMEVDGILVAWLAQFNGGIPTEIQKIVRLGLEHEQQHQELLMMDIKYILWCNPSKPRYFASSPPADSDLSGVGADFEKSSTGNNSTGNNSSEESTVWICEGGLQRVGADIQREDFCFDNETPQHKVFLQPYAISHRTVSNTEFADFIEDSGYQNSSLWLSEGWDYINGNNISAPLYWNTEAGGRGDWKEYTLHGEESIQWNVPVSHISFHEAYAYARWANKRLPTEFEWEYFAKHEQGKNGDSEGGNLEQYLENNLARAYYPEGEKGFVGVSGGLWEWTSSAYAPYPGYYSEKDAFGEYNGKFMINQMVLRGGCFATPRAHFRVSYRNFYQASQRWAFTGIRLAENTL